MKTLINTLNTTYLMADNANGATMGATSATVHEAPKATNAQSASDQMEQATDLSTFKFPLVITKVVSKKSGEIPARYAIDKEETSLDLDMMIEGGLFPIHSWLTNEIGRLAYQYWTSTNAELVPVGEPVDGVQYKAFSDTEAFYAFLTSKATGGKISGSMRMKAALDVDGILKEIGAPTEARNSIKKLIVSSVMTEIHDLYLKDPKLVDNIITALGETTGNLAVLQNWKDGKAYKPPVKVKTEGLADMFNKLKSKEGNAGTPQA